MGPSPQAGNTSAGHELIDMASRRSPQRPAKKAPVRLHVGRLAILILLLVGGAFYVQPLRNFFSQQDRYLSQASVLEQARAENATLKAQVARLRTRAYITRQAREEFQLVPAGMQVFVVKGLPESAPVPEADPVRPPAVARPSVVERLRDLWQTLGR
jgi:cell division protein FtsB